MARSAYLRAAGRPGAVPARPAHRALARIGAATAPEGYVRRTGLRLTIHRWRRPHREVSAGEPAERGAQDPGSRLVEPGLAVDDLLRALPPRMRVVPVLRYVDGLADDVVADRLGVSTGTVRSRAHRATAQVRARIARQAVPDGTTGGGPDVGPGARCARRDRG